jgi:23S rRNA (guanosine2251-2'-O)-methyltransferase
MPKSKYVQIESKNAVLELLKDNKEFEKILLASNAYKDFKTKEIVKIASERHIPIERVSRRALGRRVKSSNFESIVGLMYSDNMWAIEDLINDIYENKKQPFFIILDHIKYDQNLGAIMRTAFGAGVNGIITPVKKEDWLNNEIARISMGASERIPIVEMNLFQAIKELKKNAIRVFAVTMNGTNYFKADLKGPIAFVLGAEDVGISTGVMERADENVSIPMREGIGSLNVSASSAVLLYEKLRQEVA